MPEPRILLITRNLPPLVGGMERLIWQAALGLAQHAALTVLGPKGCREVLPRDITTNEVPLRLAPFVTVSMAKAWAITGSTTFDIVIVGSGLCAPVVLMAAKRSKAKSVLFVHGLDLVINNQVYQRLFLPCIRRADQLIANSENTRYIAQDKGIEPTRIAVVNPGTHLPEPGQIGSYSDFCRQHNIPFARFIIFTGRMTERKGLSEFIVRSFPAIANAAPDVGLVVIGHEPSNSLNKRGEEALVHQAVEQTGLHGRIRFLGQLPDEELTTGYTHASVQIFPLRNVPGDVEGFGMVAVEAAACGTPTVAFNVGGVSDAVTGDNGHLVEPGNYSVFAERVIEILSDSTPTELMCRDFAKQFAWPVYNQQVKDLIQSLHRPNAVAT